MSSRPRRHRDQFFESTNALYCTCDHRVESHDITAKSTVDSYTPSTCMYPMENGEQCPCDDFDPKPYKNKI